MDPESRSLLMLADISRLDDRIQAQPERDRRSPFDGGDHAYVALTDFDLLVNSTHNYYDRIFQSELNTDAEHSYAFSLPSGSQRIRGPIYENEYTDGIPDTDNINMFPDSTNPIEEFTCEWNGCGCVLGSSEDLEAHLSTHLAGSVRHCKWKGCAQEGHQFAARYILREHLRSHFGFLPFKCENCEKSFRRRDGLDKHRSTVHRDREEVKKALSTFPCQECGKPFKTSAERCRHVRRAHQMVRIMCDTCGELFASNTSLRRHHVRKHSV